MERDNVGATVDFFKINHLYVVGLGKFHIGINVIGQHMHAKSAKNSYQNFGDAAHSDDSHRLAVHIEAHKSVELEIELACPVHRTVDLAVETKHERSGILGYSMGRVGGHTHHNNLVLGSLQINIIEACTAESNEFYSTIGKVTDNRGVDIVVDEDTDSIHALGQLHALLAETVGEIVNLKAIVLVVLLKTLAVVAFRIEESNLYHLVCWVKMNGK